ncbi:DNA helicase, partial [Butyricicoccus sp. 1XD8-22]
YQNSKAGLKTLIASQSNLAVDNALGRLLSNKDIRILRYGRTESIEEEGKKFIEENVADYWKAQTLQAVTNEISQHKTKENELQEEISKCENEIEHLKAQEETLHLVIEKKNKAKIELEKITEEISSLKKKIIPLKKEREKTELALEKLSETKDKITTRINELNEQLALLGTVDSIEGQIKE